MNNVSFSGHDLAVHSCSFLCICLAYCVLYYSDYVCATTLTYDQIPLSSANEDLQPVLAAKRRILALNKKDLANPNIMNVSMDTY